MKKSFRAHSRGPELNRAKPSTPLQPLTNKFLLLSPGGPPPLSGPEAFSSCPTSALLLMPRASEHCSPSSPAPSGLPGFLWLQGWDEEETNTKESLAWWTELCDGEAAAPSERSVFVTVEQRGGVIAHS